MYLDGHPDEKTTLREGDRCLWNTHHGTVCLLRGASPLRQHGGDDKYMIAPQNLVGFSEVVKMLAEAAGFTPVLEGESDGGKIISYRFA